MKIVEGRMLRKPSWLDQQTYAALLQVRGQQCSWVLDDGTVCGRLDNLSVDHDVPRSRDGTDDLSNLLIRCVPHNSQKGVRPDPRWDRVLYFDNSIDWSHLRTAHRTHCADVVDLYSDWFTLPWSQITRKLYTLAWVVASGKTLAIPTLGFALNRAVRQVKGAHYPRVDRILVLTKEQAIRDQLAYDLSRDLTRFGIAATDPRVKVIHDGWQLRNSIALEQADIWVACVQQLWTENGQPPSDLAEILAYFPLIIIDEAHFAIEQALQVVDTATCSLCFGPTGTPITAKGDALKRYILFSLYTYQDAQEHDSSLKHLAYDVIEEFDITGAVVHSHGEDRAINSTDEEPDYAIQAEPMKHVADRVVGYVRDCDDLQYRPDSWELADHHERDDLADLWYPVHAIIWCATVADGRRLDRYLAEKFSGNRARYAADRGYQAAVIHADHMSADGKIKGARLDEQHPWKRYQETGFLDRKCARFLIVIGMAREGVNNPYCAVVGVTAECESIVEIVQRWLGRPLRAVMAIDAEGRRHVPPKELDTPKIFLHKAHENRAILERGIDFVLNMDTALAHMPTLESLIAGADVDSQAALNNPDPLTTVEKIDIAGRIGRARCEGRDFVCGPDDLPLWPTYSPRKQEHIEKWVKRVQETPSEALDLLCIRPSIRARAVVRQEYPDVASFIHPGGWPAPPPEPIKRYVAIHQPEALECLDEYWENKAFRVSVNSAYKEWVKSYHDTELTAGTLTVERIRQILVRKIQERVGPYLQGDPGQSKRAIHAAVGRAVQAALGAPGSVHQGGEFDTPQHHAILLRPEVDREMGGSVIYFLIRKGYCPELAAGFRLTPEGLDDAEAV